MQKYILYDLICYVNFEKISTICSVQELTVFRNFFKVKEGGNKVESQTGNSCHRGISEWMLLGSFYNRGFLFFLIPFINVYLYLFIYYQKVYLSSIIKSSICNITWCQLDIEIFDYLKYNCCFCETAIIT